MATEAAQMTCEGDDIYALQAKITKQASLVKQMKKDGQAVQDINAAVEVLIALRAKAAEMDKAATPAFQMNKKAFDEMLLRKMFVVPSFEIHNGPAGLFDYGPACCPLKANVIALWRQYFVVEENMLEMECTNLTPSNVLETSGHVERFTDFMVRDEVTGECFRADKLLEDSIDTFIAANKGLSFEEQEEHRKVQRQAGGFSADQLHEMIQKYNIKSPANNPLTPPFPFNLMFKTTIGPEGTAVGFLRPETAQGLFVNFKRLLDFNQQRMPFAAAQVGLGFRNEIAPRNGLLRVREFTMAEIEHFVNPNDKKHPKFASVADKRVVLFSSEAQLGSGRTLDTTIGEAVRDGIINNETLGYFMARTQIWLEKIGVNPKRMRFRQHLKTEMAHYACDCWDMEIHLSYGWIECVGNADRACYDLQQHSQKTGVALVASERLAAPMQVEKFVVEPNRKLLGPKFKTEQKKVIALLEAMSSEEVEAMQAQLAASGTALVGAYEITSDLVTIKKENRTIMETKYIPSVIEPSFGIGRIIYALLEHSFDQREGDEQRCLMRFKPCVAPIKVGIYRLINNAQFDPVVNSIHQILRDHNIVCKIDSSSGTVGRRYSRADELGLPFGVTIDFQTLIDNTITLRERDTMAQIRIPIANLASIICSLVNETTSWEKVMSRYPVFYSADEDDSDAKKTTAAQPVSSVTIERTPRAAFSRPAL